MRVSIPSVAVAICAAAVGVAAADDCVSSLHVIVARATNEKQGEGGSGKIAAEVVERINGSDSTGLVYPATFLDPAYSRSAEEGAEQLHKDILSYREKCPDAKMALLGYSQGAQVIMNTVCGTSSEFGFGNETALSKSLIEESSECLVTLESSLFFHADHTVVAIVTFGDPSFVANTTYAAGTSIREGVFARDNVTYCEAFSDRLIEYCDTGDVYCDSGNNSTTHGSYINVYGDEAVDYIVDHYNNATGGSGNSSDSGSDSGSGSSSSNSDSDDAGNAAFGVGPTVGLMGLVALGTLMVL